MAKNFAIASVENSPSTTGTTLRVPSGYGDLFPPTPFSAVVVRANELPTANNSESVRVTAVVNDTFTIVRAQDWTTAQDISSSGWRIFSHGADVTPTQTLTDVQALQSSITSLTANLAAVAVGTNFPNLLTTGDLTAGGRLRVTGGVSGVAAFAGDTYSHVLVAAGLNANPLTHPHQVGFYAAHQVNSNADGADSFGAGFETAIGIGPGTFELEKLVAYAVGVFSSTGGTLLRSWNFSAVDQTLGTHNAVIAMWNSEFVGNWFIHYEGSRPSRLSGGDLIGPSEIYRSSNSAYLRLAGGGSGGDGANLLMFGSTAGSGNANKAQFNATGGITINGSTMVIDPSGQVFIQETVGVIFNPALGVAFSGTGFFGAGLEIVNTGNTSGATFMAFNAGGVTCGSITRVTTTASVNYGTVSDQRLKRDFQPFTDALERVLEINAGSYIMKDSGHTGYGCIAQQLHTIYPAAVTPGPTESDMWSIDYGKLTPLLIGSTKQLHQRLERVEQILEQMERKE